MYKLTLTHDERQAIDWIGNRYGHGDDLFFLLIHNCQTLPSNADWFEEGNITFNIPEYVAWNIYAIGEECNFLWDCFVEELSAKLTNFCDNIV
jgi:hypothetical protein